MKKFKDFFEKKQSEMKFKMAGTGHKLGDTNRPSNSSAAAASSSSATARPPPQRSGGPDENVAKAALARFENKTTAPKSNLTNIMQEEKQKIIQEIKLKEELEERKKKAAEKVISGPPGMSEFDKGQKFVCPSLEIKSALPFDELLKNIKANINENFKEDPVLRSLMCLHNCNRTIDQNDSRVKGCVDILQKILKNMMIDDPEELEKFKRIRKSKIEQKVLSVDGALEFLLAIGFSPDATSEWLIFQDTDNVNIQESMLYLVDLLENPQIIPIELDRQLKHLEDKETNSTTDDLADLNLTSSDVKKIYNNMERTREINEMFVSKETKNNMLANRSSNNNNQTCLFTRLRFKFGIIPGEALQVVEATFAARETLNDVKAWFVDNFMGLLGEDDRAINFRNGTTLLADQQGASTLAELKLTPAATLLVLIS